MRFITMVRVQMGKREDWPQALSNEPEVMRWAVRSALLGMVPEGWGAHQWTVTRPILRRSAR
jgi:hypothetical protein